MVSVGCKHKGCEGCIPIEGCKPSKCKAYKRARINTPEYVAHKKEYDAARKAAGVPKNRDVVRAREYSKEYRAANQEKVKADLAKYRAENREALAAYKRKYDQVYYEANHVDVGDFKGLVHEDGSVTRMRSMSEVYFFSMLEEEGVAYEYEVKLTTPMGVYIADGFLPELNIYVEVKADFYVRDNQMNKINYLREQGYSIIMIDSDLVDSTFGL